MSETVAATGLPTIPLPRLTDSLAPITTALDAATAPERLAWMRGLSNRELAALFELARGSAMRAEDLCGAGDEVVACDGKNGLPAFSYFQKRFARCGDEIVGYNHNPGLVTFFVGPGHFVVYDSPEVPGEVWIDYRRLPKQRHPAFPELVVNDKGVGPRVVYGGMVDKVRRVSAHVFIGNSYAGTEKPKGVWFALCRP